MTPAFNQLFAIVVDEAFVRTGAHTQQCYVAPVHHDDIAWVTPKRGICTPIVAFDHEKDRMIVNGWVKTAQISPLKTEVADMRDDTSTTD